MPPSAFSLPRDLCLHHRDLEMYQHQRTQSMSRLDTPLTCPELLPNLVLLNRSITGLFMRFLSPPVHLLVVPPHIFGNVAVRRPLVLENLGLGALRTFGAASTLLRTAASPALLLGSLVALLCRRRRRRAGVLLVFRGVLATVLGALLYHVAVGRAVVLRGIAVLVDERHSLGGAAGERPKERRADDA